MSYICECGNKEKFLEAHDISIDAVDGNGNFVRRENHNVAFYTCPDCDREISYEEFWRKAEPPWVDARNKK